MMAWPSEKDVYTQFGTVPYTVTICLQLSLWGVLSVALLPIRLYRTSLSRIQNVLIGTRRVVVLLLFLSLSASSTQSQVGRTDLPQGGRGPHPFLCLRAKSDLAADPPFGQTRPSGRFHVSSFPENDPDHPRRAVRFFFFASLENVTLVPWRAPQSSKVVARCGATLRLPVVLATGNLRYGVGGRVLRTRRLAPVTSSEPSVTGAQTIWMRLRRCFLIRLLCEYLFHGY